MKKFLLILLFVAPIIVGGRDAKTFVEGNGVKYIKDSLRFNKIDIKKIDKLSSNNPYSPSIIAGIKQEFNENPDKTKEKYPDLFFYFDGLLGTNVSQSMHPAENCLNSRI